MNKNYLIIDNNNKIVQTSNCSEEEKILNDTNNGLRYVEYTEELPILKQLVEYTYENGVIIEKAWVLTLEEVKKSKYKEIKLAQTNALNAIVGELASSEPVSYTKQETEARAWNNDNNTATPFIDNLLISRNLGETKQELVDKIIAKADAYQVFYASILGKFQALVKQIDAATTVDEVNKITWN